jgi:molybdopterin converting factor small subunit
MSVSVELFGIPRERAGVAQTTATAGTLAGVLLELGERYPRFAESCLQSGALPGGHGALAKGYIVNLNGERFISDELTPLKPGDAILIFSADAGG